MLWAVSDSLGRLSLCFSPCALLDSSLSLVSDFNMLDNRFAKTMTFTVLCILFLHMVPSVDGVNPNVQKDYDELPAMGNIKWDGIPSPYFMEQFYDPLMNALGSVSENGATLFMTALGIDPGGTAPGANPIYAMAPQNVRQQSAMRNRKLFACVMNYILATASIYVFMQRNFRNDGMSAVRYIRQFGYIPFAESILKRMRIEWDELTLTGLIKRMQKPLSSRSIFDLVENIHERARRLNETNINKKIKFLDALPSIMTHIRSKEKLNRVHAGYAFPNLYPPNFPAHLAGQPHPSAGEPDIDRLARMYSAEWTALIVEGHIKPEKTGILNAIGEYDGLFDQSQVGPSTSLTLAPDGAIISPIMFSKVTPTTECLLCGGFGHGVHTTMEDGTTVDCATHKLGIKPEKRSKFDIRKTQDKFKSHYKNKYRQKYTQRSPNMSTGMRHTQAKKPVLQVDSDIGSESSMSQVDSRMASSDDSEDSMDEISAVAASTSRLNTRA